jgi:hypothetical protein
MVPRPTHCAVVEDSGSGGEGRFQCNIEVIGTFKTLGHVAKVGETLTVALAPAKNIKLGLVSW